LNDFEMLFAYDVESVGVRPLPTLPSTGIREAFGVDTSQFLGSGSFGEAWRIPQGCFILGWLACLRRHADEGGKRAGMTVHAAA